MDIAEIQEKYTRGDYSFSYDFDDLKILPPDHVFDENLSIRKNREMVEIHNVEVRQKKLDIQQKRNELMHKMRDDVVDYIMTTYRFPKKLAEFVESEVYEKEHSFMYDYFGAIDETATLIEHAIALMKEEKA